MALKVREKVLGLTTGIDTTRLYPASRILQSVTGWMIPRNKPIFGENAFNHESGIHQHGVLSHRETYEIIRPEEIGRPRESLVLGRHSGRHAFRQRLEQYAVGLDEAAFEEAFTRFTQLADQKKEMGDDDILALVSDVLDLPHQEHRLDYYHIVTGNAMIPGATVRLVGAGADLTASADGDGPVDALYRAIDKALGMETTLDEYLVTAIGSGKEAQGRVRVGLRIGHEQVDGMACSTDILKASALAYLNAVNRYLRKNKESNKELQNASDPV
jgi:2-isopropylmalate synthase